MKLLLAVDSITTLNILLDEVVVRSWPDGTKAQVPHEEETKDHLRNRRSSLLLRFRAII